MGSAARCLRLRRVTPPSRAKRPGAKSRDRTQGSRPTASACGSANAGSEVVRTVYGVPTDGITPTALVHCKSLERGHRGLPLPRVDQDLRKVRQTVILVGALS